MIPEEVSKDTNAVNLLKQLSDLTPNDLDRFLKFIKSGADNKVEHSEDINKYLSIVRQVFGNSSYLTLGDTVETRQQRYEIYDEMDESTSYISAALDILSDDATQVDEEGNLITIVCENSKVKSIVEDLFDRLDIESKLSKWGRAVAKYGDLFLKLTIENNEIKSVNDTLYPSSIERRDFEGKLVAFCDSYDTMSTDSIYTPWDFVHFRLKGDIYRSQQNTRSSGIDKRTKIYSLTSSYGQSILRPAIKVYAQLRFVENLIILSRLTNSIKRNIFLINTGDTDPSKAFETIRNYADLLKKDISLDIERGIYNSQRHTITYDEDIFIPVSDTKNDVRIESIGGDINVREQYDLEYLLNKLFSALKIPKAYLNYEQDLNARSTLVQLDIRYARSVGQLQVALTGGLMRLAKIQLAYHGIDPDTVDLDIQLTPVSSIDQESRLEQRNASIEAAKNMWDMVITMNDKLAESQQSSSTAGGMFGEDIAFKSPNMPGPTIQNHESPKTPLDLEYLVDHIFSNYFDIGREDVDRILRKPINKSKDENTSVKLKDKRYYPNSDIHEMYPLGDNLKNFTSIREGIIKGLRGQGTSNTEDLSVTEENA